MNDDGSGRRNFIESLLGIGVLTGTAVRATPLRAQGATPRTAPTDAPAAAFLPGFEAFRIDTGEVVISGVKAGSGPPLLLLHGWPQTHVEWHRLAPLLAKKFTVVATDLRGYGDSGKPPDGASHGSYSKRAMAADQVATMSKLGFERFAVVGHDRGARVAHRMALDHPERISKAVLIDIVPTYYLYQHVTRDFASAYFHWFFLTQPAPIPETLLAGRGDFFLKNWAFDGLVPGVVSDECLLEYRRHFDDPATLHAMCEDYRAAASIDLEHDKADLEKKVACPLLVLWGARGAMGALYDVEAIWKTRGTDVRGKALAAGHWIPEELPDQLHTELVAFLG